MALLFLDGCDLHGSNADILHRWTTATGGVNVDVPTTAGRFGGGCVRVRTSSAVESLGKTPTAPITGTAIVGAAIRLVPNITTSTGNNRLLQLADSGGTAHLTLAWSSADQLFRRYRGTAAGTLLATSAVTFAADAWGYID
jgi:hypothetical protein